MATRSPERTWRVAFRRPTTAGIFRERERMAACEVVPPRSVAYPRIWFRLKMTVSAGVRFSEMMTLSPSRREKSY